MSKIRTCRVRHGKGTLKVKRYGFRKRYIKKCRDYKAETIEPYTPEKVLHEWNTGWIFSGYHNAL